MFRWGWAAFCCALWWAAVEMAGHRSASPVVLGRWSPAWFAAFATAAGAATAASVGLLPRVYPRLRANSGALAFSALLTGALCLGSLEALFRADFLGASYHEETARYLRETLPDSELKYRHRPGFATRYQGVPVVFNAMGLRERPIPLKGPGETRVVVLGDSVAFGWGVPEEETFGRRLEKRLHERLGRPVRTINTGVCSYNTVQQLRYLKREGQRLQPDAVLLLYVENDVLPFLPAGGEGSMLAVRGRPGALSDWLLGRSWTYRVGYHLSRPLLAGETLDPSAEGYQASLAALEELAREAADLGAKFGVVSFRMAHRPASDRLVEDLEEVGRRSGFPVKDAAPWFAGKDLRALTNSVTDTHPNGKGHAVMAEGAACMALLL